MGFSSLPSSDGLQRRRLSTFSESISGRLSNAAACQGLGVKLGDSSSKSLLRASLSSHFPPLLQLFGPLLCLSLSYSEITRRKSELEYFLLRSNSDAALRSKREVASVRTRLSFNGGRDRGSGRARFRGFIHIELGFCTSFAREQSSPKESVLEISATATPDSGEEREGTVT